MKEELIRKLSGLRDEARASVAINKVFDRDELPPGPYKENCPELIIGYNEGYRVSWDSVTGKANSVVFEDNHKAWSGDHCIDPRLVPGVLFCNKKMNSQAPKIIDIAPTVLELFGIPVPSHMDGRGLIDVEHQCCDKTENRKKTRK